MLRPILVYDRDLQSHVFFSSYMSILSYLCWTNAVVEIYYRMATLVYIDEPIMMAINCQCLLIKLDVLHDDGY